MSETADSITSNEAQDIPGHDVSSKPLSLSLHSKELQPPPHSADPTMDLPPKDEMTGTSQPTIESQSGNNINPDASTDTKTSMSQSTKGESCSNEDPKASTKSKTGTSQPTTKGQSCDDINPDASSMSQSTAKDQSYSNEDAEASTDATTDPLKPTTEKESSNDADPEAPTDTSQPETLSPFDDQTVRRAFVRKVFCIVILMLLFTFGVVCLFTFSEVVKKGVKDNIWVFISSFIIFSVVLIILSFIPSLSRRHPWNLVGLSVITLTFSYMLGTTASYFDTTAVLIAMGYTIIISLAIIAFAAQSRVDFNMCFGFILIVTVIMIMFGIMYGILSSCSSSRMSDLIFGGLGAFVLSMFLMVDIQLMMGRHKDRVDPEEYASAALLIYLDIMLVFIWILKHLNN